LIGCLYQYLPPPGFGTPLRSKILTTLCVLTPSTATMRRCGARPHLLLVNLVAVARGVVLEAVIGRVPRDRLPLACLPQLTSPAPLHDLRSLVLGELVRRRGNGPAGVGAPRDPAHSQPQEKRRRPHESSVSAWRRREKPRTAVRVGCRVERPPRLLVTVPGGCLDGLVFLDGDRGCRPCAKCAAWFFESSYGVTYVEKC
jgi:hypothetical protein